MKPGEPDSDDYVIEPCAVGDLGTEDLAACIALVAQGGAVDTAHAKRDLPRALKVTVIRKGGKIVGVGTIKPVRRGYASGIADKSGVSFDAGTPELGYVAVHPDHRGNRLSHRLVESLVPETGKPLIATTSSEAMKATLAKAGFTSKGHAWKGRRGDQISLWTRE